MAQLTIKDIKTLQYERPDIQRGYANQTLSVNLSDSVISIKLVDEKMKEVFVGGKGFPWRYTCISRFRKKHCDFSLSHNRFSHGF
jgi:hypothetical protein